ncbi:hypothetical protein MICAG_500013 [Microcystis aeruginosa PCC 9808]|uniref:Transposase n=2 Tax=Microcystis TaxID=1125 RepID=I4I2P9_MICAE|nr:MAG: hypothetical protein DWQ54_13840 [Microcystis flos-aquae TF09]CCI28573.1 hypothetical protein MICAG_500013 [Microcystis aeruginosa PCC 9808]
MIHRSKEFLVFSTVLPLLMLNIVFHNVEVIARLVILVKPSICDSIELDFDHLGEANYDRL